MVVLDRWLYQTGGCTRQVAAVESHIGPDCSGLYRQVGSTGAIDTVLRSSTSKSKYSITQDVFTNGGQ